VAENKDQEQQKATVQKVVSLREDGYYSNCTMVEANPFDISMLFGKIRHKTDEKGQQILMEIYEKQIYLSHLQAMALHRALGQSLQSVSKAETQRPVEGKK
jgi:hypothetical protein